MFTGIVEGVGKVCKVKRQGSNIDFLIKSPFLSELKVDQSISHNGVCLTVTKLNKKSYEVTAIQETLDKSNLGKLKKGSYVNLERCMKIDSRIDGHIVQGHVDTVGKCIKVKDQEGSWLFTFQYPKRYSSLIISKGSICVNGVSLTVSNLEKDVFTVAIIPYTYDNTIFHKIRKGDIVNLEFDILGKYIARRLDAHL